MKRIIALYIILILVLTAAFASAESVQKAYYNDDYAYLLDEDPVFVSLTLEEAYYLLGREGSYLILLGGSWCGNTTPVIRYINEVAKEYGVSTIYNLDFRLDGVDRSSHVRETEGAQSKGAVIPGSHYNYLYGELASRYLTNLNDYVEYKIDTESAVVYTDPAGNRDVCYCYVRSWSAPTDWVITYDSSGETENTYSPPGDWCMSIRNKWEWKGQKVINEFFVVKLSSPEEQLKEGSTLSFNGEKWIVSYSDVYSTDQELYASYSVYRVISSTGWNDESVSINYDEYDVVNWRCKEILAYTYSNSSLGV